MAAVGRDLEDVRRRSPKLAQSALAATALALAAQLDNPHTSATSKSMCAKALLDTLDQVRELCPPEEEPDEVDELAARRTARRAGGSAS